MPAPTNWWASCWYLNLTTIYSSCVKVQLSLLYCNPRIPEWGKFQNQLLFVNDRCLTGHIFFYNGLPGNQCTCVFSSQNISSVVSLYSWPLSVKFSRNAQTPSLASRSKDNWFYHCKASLNVVMVQLLISFLAGFVKHYFPSWSLRSSHTNFLTVLPHRLDFGARASESLLILYMRTFTTFLLLVHFVRVWRLVIGHMYFSVPSDLLRASDSILLIFVRYKNKCFDWLIDL